MKFYQKYLFFFLLFFLVHYLEGMEDIGGFSFAQLWKTPLLLYLLLFNMMCLKSRTLFEKSNYLLSIEYLLSPETLIRPISVVITVIKQLPFVLFFRYWIVVFNERKESLEKILYSFAQFICLSTIPFLLDMMQPLEDCRNAEAFGIEGLTYFSGILGSPHAAASYFCASILVLLNGFLLNRFQTKASKFYNASLIIIGLVSIFKAYTRTGWLMLFVGLFCFVRLSKVTVRQATVTLFALLISIGGVIYLYNNNQAFQARLTGKNIFEDNSGEHLETGGSGRISFWYNAVNNLWNADNVYCSLFGRGYTQVVEDNFRTTGMRVFSHNQFLDSFSQNGLLGVSLLILFYFFLYSFIKRRNGEYKRLCNGLFFSNLTFAIFQNEMYFNFAFIFSLAVALLSMENDNESSPANITPSFIS